MRTSKPLTVTLGQQQKSVEERVASGAYASASEVVRAALRALDREEKALDEVMRYKIHEAINDQRPDIPAEDVFKKLRSRHAERIKAAKG